MSFHRQDWIDAANNVGEWFKAHPTVAGILAAFVAGFIVGKIT